MPYLLDGNNLIGMVRKTSRPSEQDRAALITEIADRLRKTRARATIFFDGPAGARPSALGSLTVKTPNRGSADQAILDTIASSRAPGELVVVTADRDLARRARDAGAKITAPHEFFARFGTAVSERADPAPAGAVDVEDWLRYFGDEHNRD